MLDPRIFHLYDGGRYYGGEKPGFSRGKFTHGRTSCRLISDLSTSGEGALINMPSDDRTTLSPLNPVPKNEHIPISISAHIYVTIDAD